MAFVVALVIAVTTINMALVTAMRLAAVTVMTLATIMLLICAVLAPTSVAIIGYRRHRRQRQAHSQKSYQRQSFKSS